MRTDTVTVGSWSLIIAEKKAQKAIERMVSDGWTFIGSHDSDCLDGYQITLSFKKKEKGE